MPFSWDCWRSADTERLYRSLDSCRVLEKVTCLGDDEPRGLRVQDSRSVICRFVTIISTKYLHLQLAAFATRSSEKLIVNPLKHVPHEVDATTRRRCSRNRRSLRIALSTHARQLEIYSVIHLYNRTLYNNSKNNYNRLITVELLITIVLAVFLSWCVCNDVPSVCVCLMRSPFLTIARSSSFTSHHFHSIHVSESISHLSRSFNTHDATHIRLLNLTSLNLH